MIFLYNRFCKRALYFYVEATLSGCYFSFSTSMMTKKMYQIISSILMTCLIRHSHSVITPYDIPESIYDCYERCSHTYPFTEQPAERIATTCLTNYAWTVTGVRCQNMTKKTMDLIGRLLLPYLHKRRSPRQAGNGVNRVRKEYRKLSEDERSRFHRALNVIKDNGRYDEIADYHSLQIRFSAHAGPAFLPWHRVYLLIMEDALREVDSSVTIPYWDCNLDFHMTYENKNPRDSIIWSPVFAGGGETPVTTGPFSHWGIQRNTRASTGDNLFSDSDLRNLFNIGTTTNFRFDLEMLHNSAHNWVGGFMSEIARAPRDPVFFLLHSYVDYLWWQWQTDNADNPATWVYPSLSGDEGEGHFPGDDLVNLQINNRSIKNSDGYSQEWAFNYFTYERTPNCYDGTCTGPYLRCIDQQGRRRDEFSNRIGGRRNFDETIYCSSVERGTDTATVPSGRKRRDVKSQFMHVSFIHPPAAPKARRVGHKFPSIEKSLGLDLSQSPLWPGEHPGLIATNGYPVQNDMRINCDRDYHLWAFLPIKVIHLRPYGNIFHAYPVSNGVMNFKLDIYSDLLYRKNSNFTKPQNPSCVENCIGDATGTSKVFLRSEGLNYYGKYNDYVIVDDRQPIDAKVGYIGIRRPDRKPTEVMVTAHDQCGRICVPKCLKKGSSPPKYEPCSGVIHVDRRNPRFYSNTYGDAVLNYWSTTNGVCPLERGENVYMIFYCDLKTRWFPWPGAYKTKKK